MGSIFEGHLVRLRGIEPEDWEAFRSFDRHTDDMRNADIVHPPRSAAGYREWAQAQALDEGDDTQFRLAVETLADRTLVGSLSTDGVDQRAGRFAYGIGIGRDHQRRGYARDAVVVLLTYMFGERRLHKCEVGVYAVNEPSLALHRALGFREEGRLREHEFFAGRRHDLVLMGLTVDEFAERHPFTTTGP
ncbi:GNAT family protein [Actinomycetes bacterium KLBMP 9759]